MKYHEIILFLTKTTIEMEVILIVWVPILSLTKGPFFNIREFRNNKRVLLTTHAGCCQTFLASGSHH